MSVRDNGDVTRPTGAYDGAARRASDRPAAAITEAWQATLDSMPLDGAAETSLNALSSAIAALLISDPIPSDTVVERARAIGQQLASIAPAWADRPIEGADGRSAPLSPERFAQVLGGVISGLQDVDPGGPPAIENPLIHLANRLQYFQSTHQAILSTEALSDILDLSVQFVDALLPSLSTSVVTYDFAAGEFIMECSTRPEFRLHSRRPVTLWDMIAQLRRGEIFYIADVRLRPDCLPGLQTVLEVGGRSFLSVPMRYRGELIGAFTMAMGDVYEFNPDELAVVQEIANVIAVVIQHRQALQAEQKARQNEATLREVAASLTLGLALDEILQRILNQLERVVIYSSASIILLENGKPVLAAQRGLQNTPQELDVVLATDPHTLNWVLMTGRPRIINDTTADETWTVLPGLEYIHAWMGVPLLVKGVCIGVLTIDREQPNSFTPQDQDLVLAFANQAAIAIENARLFREAQTYAEQMETRVRERTRELEALYGITAATLEGPDLDSVLYRSLELALQAFGCPAGAIYLTHNGERALRPAICLDRSGSEFARLLSEPTAGGGLLSRLAPDGAPWIVDDVLPTALFGEPVQAVAVAPLRARARSLGVLVLLSDEPRRFAGASLLLTTIADQIGAAVESIDLRHKARQAAIVEERDRLARELHDAVTQAIYSIGLFAEAARDATRAGEPDRVERHLQSVMQTSHQALGEMRLLLYELRTEALAHHGLAGALGERLQSVENRAEIDTELQIEGVTTLPLALEETYYRVALEALNNSLRHARAGKVTVTLTARHGELIMIIQDNGSGFRVRDPANRGGMGLDIMHKRTQKVAGRLRITSRVGRGTRVEVRAPLNQTTAGLPVDPPSDYNAPEKDRPT